MEVALVLLVVEQEEALVRVLALRAAKETRVMARAVAQVKA